MARRLAHPSRRTLVVGLLALVLLGMVACGPDEPDGLRTERSTADVEEAPTAHDEDGDEVPVDTLEPVPLLLAPVANLDHPTAFAARPGSDVRYVTEQAGRVRVLVPTADGTLVLAPAPVLDISAEVGIDPPGGEPGLLGITFSPDGEHLYLSYTARRGLEQRWDRRITEWTMDGDVVVPGSRRVVLEITKDQPQHNGGDVRFGPDGYLYAGIGDTAPVADAFMTGQDPTDLLAAVLRIDPSAPTATQGYGVPADNPWASGTFAGQAGAPEVWLYGTRNPWRLSFDRETGDLWVADVGDQRREEITRLPAAEGGGRGANLGWSQLEGSARYRNREEPEEHVLPTWEYPHSTGGCSVIGGFVYRGSAIPALEGTYVFSDFCQPELQGVHLQEDGRLAAGPLGATVADSALAFGEDADGELYVLSATGVHALLPAP